MPIVVHICFNTFASRQQADKYISDKLSQLLTDNNDESLTISSTHTDFNWFMSMLDNHPKRLEKIGIGIDSFNIETNPMSRKGVHITFTRIDGSDGTFSRKSCISGKPKSPKDNLLIAMRQSITYDINEFRCKQKKLYCHNPICVSTTQEFEVDHKVSFDSLSNDFFMMEKSMNTPTQFSDGDLLDYRCVFKDTDSEYRQLWLTYHKNNAQLQILCKQCNRLKGNR